MKILRISSSPNLANSKSRDVGAFAVEAITAKFPETSVKHKDLAIEPPAYYSPELCEKWFTTDHSEEIFDYSNAAVAELHDADVVIIEAPMINFSITATLKSWIDQIAVAGKTFKYSETGPIGLVENTKAIIIQSSGGNYDEEPLKSIEHGQSFVNAVLDFIGITDKITITIPYTAIGGEKLENRLNAAKDSISEFVTAL